MIRQFITGTLFASALVAAPAFAAPESAAPAQGDAGKGVVELTVKSFQEITVTDKAGKKTKKTVPTARVVPGDEIIYVISYRNNGKKPAEKVLITNPVPLPVEFVAGSATAAGTTDEVSVDGGKVWGRLDALTVTGADGKPRPATGADVTTVHWKLNSPVKAGAAGSVSYRVVIE